MKSGLFKRILAMGMMAVMLAGDVIPTAAETVSGGDVAAVEETTEPIADEKTEDASDDVNPASENTDDEETPASIEETATNVSDGDVVEIEEEEVPLEDGLEDIVLKKEVNGVVITLTAPAGSLPENAELWAEEIAQTVANREQLEVIDQALEAEAKQKEIEVQKYKAFDIKVMVNGTAVQPEGEVTVTFEGDILLPEANEALTVYHITDDAVANPVGGLNEENTPEMVTDHFSTYVIVVSDEAAANSYQVTVSHYLSEDENKPVAERQKFYKSADFQLDDETIMKVPVQGGEDYNLKKVVLKDSDGNIIKSLENVVASNDQVTMEISQDTLVEMYYEPTVNANHMNEVTYFDYSIMSSGIKIEEDKLPIYWGVKISCEYKGTTYTDIEYHSGGKFYKGETNVLTVKDGAVLKNLTMTAEGKSYQADEVKVKTENGSLAFKYMAEKAYTSTKNAGINSYGVGHETEYMAMGQTGSFHDYTLYINKNGKNLNANVNNATNGGNAGAAIIPNLITGLTDDLMNVVTGPGVYEPGYFTVTPLEGKTIYSDRFDLKFNREGHKYILTSSIDNVTGKETLAGKSNADFFPLNEVPYEDTQAAVNAAGGNGESLSKGNAFYGMRYDFTFSIGDYEGPLEYTFVGDDDMWVFVDGHRVLDLGGLHQMYPTAYGTVKESNLVDLWKAVDENGNLLIDAETEEGKKKVHQVTVLYMERGGWDSTCYMEFTVPHATPLDTVITDKPKGNVEFTKIDKDTKAALAGAEFGLYKEDQAYAVKTAVSDQDGKVSFINVKPGQYYIQEISAPEGYERNETKYQVTVAGDTTVTVNGGEVENEKIKATDIRFRKVTRYGGHIPLEGAEFDLLDENKQFIAHQVSDKDGNFTFENIADGTYYLQETKAPEGYIAYEDPWTIKVDSTYVNIWNEKQPVQVLSGPGFTMWMKDVMLVKNEKAVDITIEKKWEDVNGNEIDGKEVPVDEIKVDLYRKHATKNCNENGKKVQTITLTKQNGWTATVKGLLERDDCEEWEYYIIEQAVDGYVAVSYEESDKTDTEQGYTLTLTVTNKPDVGSLIITKEVNKVNLTYGAPVFTFKIEGPDGLVMYRTITFENESELTKSITVSNVPVGDYTVTELKTLRYKLVSSDAGTKTVSGTATPEYKFENELISEKYYSHSDILINSFRKNEDGSITASQTREVTEQVEVTNQAE